MPSLSIVHVHVAHLSCKHGPVVTVFIKASWKSSKAVTKPESLAGVQSGTHMYIQHISTSIIEQVQYKDMTTQSDTLSESFCSRTAPIHGHYQTTRQHWRESIVQATSTHCSSYHYSLQLPGSSDQWISHSSPSWMQTHASSCQSTCGTAAASSC